MDDFDDDFYDDEYDSYDEDDEVGNDNYLNQKFVPFESDDVFRETVLKGSGINFTMLVEHEGEKRVYKRWGQPCYGEMRKYKRSHKELYSDPWTGNDAEPSDSYRPSDLHHPFPLGTPLAVGFKFYNYGGRGKDYKPVIFDRLVRYALSSESPWIRGLKDVEFLEVDGLVHGFIVWDTEIDSTVLISLVNSICSFSMYDGKFYEEAKEKIGKLSDKELLLMHATFSPTYGYDWAVRPPVQGLLGFNVSGGIGKGYYMPNQLDVRRFFAGDSRDLSGKKDEAGGTFKAGYDYNRKRLHEVFQDEDRKQGDAEHVEYLKGLGLTVDYGNMVEIPLEEGLEIVKKMMSHFETKEMEIAA